MVFQITTWNVNGIRNPFKYKPWNDNRTLQSMFELLEADIVCFQEVKTPKSALTDDLVFIEGWDAFYSFPHSQTGYSGVAVYTRQSKCIPLRVEEGVTGILKIPGSQKRYLDLAPGDQIGGYPTQKQLRKAPLALEAIDTEGRCLILEFPLFILINVYCPARRNQERTGYRNTFLMALDARVRNLAAMGRNVILCGDLNIMRDHLDTAVVWGHQGQMLAVEALELDEYMRKPAAKLLNQLLFNSRQTTSEGEPIIDEAVEKRRPPVLYDSCRELNPDKTGMYTCWDTRKNHRPANFGSRIDYILCSPKLMPLIPMAEIQPELIGSDHCPVYVMMQDQLPDATGKYFDIIDFLNPPGRFVNGKRALSDEKDAALLKQHPQSARRLPQFSNRQHIADMFRLSWKQVAAGSTSTESKAPDAPTATDNGGSSVSSKSDHDLPDIFKGEVIELVEPSDDEEEGEDDDDNDEHEPQEDEETERHNDTDKDGSERDSAEKADATPSSDTTQDLSTLLDKPLAKFRPVEHLWRQSLSPIPLSASGSQQGENPHDDQKPAAKPDPEQDTEPDSYMLGDVEIPADLIDLLTPSQRRSLTRRPGAPLEQSQSRTRSRSSSKRPLSDAISDSGSSTKKAKQGIQMTMNMFLLPENRSRGESNTNTTTTAASSNPSKDTVNTATPTATSETTPSPRRQATYTVPMTATTLPTQTPRQKSSREMTPQKPLRQRSASQATLVEGEEEGEGGGADGGHARTNTSPSGGKAADVEDGDDNVKIGVAPPAEEDRPSVENSPPRPRLLSPIVAARAAETTDMAKAGWSRLGLGQHQGPMCEHGEPCKIYLTRKPGVNSGRSFYTCARPPGPLGRSEKGTEWKCQTFIWCRDWKP